ncbi:(2Fe-2S)-binding protein [Chitinophaga rhizophila]|uniref:(2Fe-2S)-binding protein n=1 Tax=Chitinophaga rhizophila TaxID=2866212 RepID=A0ABS7G8U7_9BACT|nr:(2Fe-2S)-binding protein [Chitinophaga rhizophila]MBW8683821.1 (2Fe-2S)-binding protein [Chitinophaga rhizophila]
MKDDQLMNEEHSGTSRRSFLKRTSLMTAMALAPETVIKAAEKGLDEKIAATIETMPLNVTINGVKQSVRIEPRVTLLDLLRERLQLTGTKKGCDHGQCGACTVHIDGERVNACLTLAVTTEGRDVTTIEGLAKGDELHPMQEAFLEHDGFQCGYCTPGQIMSAICCIREGHADTPDEIREYMSGNICRCGAYSNIVDAIMDVKQGGKKV